MVNVLLAIQLANIVANGNKFCQNSGTSPQGNITAGLAAASIAQNTASLVYNVAGAVSPVGLIAFGDLVNKANFVSQSAALSAAIQNNDPQQITARVLGIVGSVAGIIGSYPLAPKTISVPAKAISILATSASMLASDPTAWAQMSTLCDDLSGALQNSFDFWKGLMNADLSRSVDPSAWTTPFTAAQAAVCPLVLDLDGNGVQVTAIDQGVYFDHNGDGFAEQSAWASATDGILVRDRNGDGKITNGNELIGDQTRMKNGLLGKNGFEVIAEYDDNHDGKINNQDAIWNQLQVWVDANQDGVSQAGELHSLAAVGVQSMDVSYSQPNGPGTLASGHFTKTDGTKGVRHICLLNR